MKRRQTNPRRRNPQDPRPPIPASATVRRFDGHAVKLELVFQPQDALRLADFLLNALLRARGGRK